ncbi:MAG: N-acetylglucosaminyl-diphospho-decaprenol L-rhamnosyltransferase [Solirubrobacteraceae bacterium]|nr:N-acetylglucosaminyl-diphospho-decaprenol L-rhamnosyltransferase [Solirubrobacteraceae bacterium]
MISLVSTDNRVLVEACLRSLPAACEGLAWRVTVVDNASTDDTAEMIERDFPQAQLLRNDRRLGFSANHNRVVQPVLDEDLARYVVILNEDTELDSGCVARLVAFADERPRVGVVGPEIYGTDGERQPSYFPFPSAWGQFIHTLLPGRMSRTRKTGGWLNGSCLLVRVAALREIGPLDERFFIFFEDTDLGYRMLEAGWDSIVAPGPRILHHGHMTVSQPALGSAMERQMLRSRYLYFEKHRGRRQAHLVANAVRFALFARAVKAWARREGTADGRRAARVLMGIAKYSPTETLEHE